MSHLYRHIDVWQRISKETLIRFVCFQNLETEKYICQQGVSYKSKYIHNEKFQRHLDWDTMNFYEGLFESYPEDRLDDGEPHDGYETLLDAIKGWREKWGM